MNNEQIIKEYWNEVDSIRRDLVENGEDGEIHRFGHKTKRGNELFIVVDWKNIESFILQVRTDTINEIRKEVDKTESLMLDECSRATAQNQFTKGFIVGVKSCIEIFRDIKTFLNKLDN